MGRALRPGPLNPHALGCHEHRENVASFRGAPGQFLSWESAGIPGLMVSPIQGF